MAKKTLVIVSAILLVCVYVSGYAYMRHAHILIHKASYYTDRMGDGQVLIAGHSISKGDFIGQIQPGAALLALVSGYIYLPLMMVEEIYWKTVQPVSTFWPYSKIELE